MVADRPVDWSSGCLDISDLESCFRYYIRAIMISWWNVCLSGPLMICYHQPLIKNIRITSLRILGTDGAISWADGDTWPDIPKLTIWFWTCPVGCCTCCVDDLGLYCIWLTMAPYTCSDESWTILASSFLACAASCRLVPAWLVP
jgi:hypothetical protein